jgi:hypothetical protein
MGLFGRRGRREKSPSVDLREAAKRVIAARHLARMGWPTHAKFQQAERDFQYGADPHKILFLLDSVEKLTEQKQELLRAVQAISETHIHQPVIREAEKKVILDCPLCAPDETWGQGTWSNHISGLCINHYKILADMKDQTQRFKLGEYDRLQRIARKALEAIGVE